jgi:hypothetical protein
MVCWIIRCGIDHTEHETQNDNMKKLLIPTAVALSATLLLTGCLVLKVGGGDKKEVRKATIGQQLTALKTAKDAGAITDAEHETQKAKLLGGK